MLKNYIKINPTLYVRNYNKNSKLCKNEHWLNVAMTDL